MKIRKTKDGHTVSDGGAVYGEGKGWSKEQAQLFADALERRRAAADDETEDQAEAAEQETQAETDAEQADQADQAEAAAGQAGAVKDDRSREIGQLRDALAALEARHADQGRRLDKIQARLARMGWRD